MTDSRESRKSWLCRRGGDARRQGEGEIRNSWHHPSRRAGRPRGPWVEGFAEVKTKKWFWDYHMDFTVDILLSRFWSFFHFFSPFFFLLFLLFLFSPHMFLVLCHCLLLPQTVVRGERFDSVLSFGSISLFFCCFDVLAVCFPIRLLPNQKLQSTQFSVETASPPPPKKKKKKEEEVYWTETSIC